MRAGDMKPAYMEVTSWRVGEDRVAVLAIPLPFDPRLLTNSLRRDVMRKFRRFHAAQTAERQQAFIDGNLAYKGLEIEGPLAGVATQIAAYDDAQLIAMQQEAAVTVKKC